jgi:uncharacterized membrane protein
MVKVGGKNKSDKKFWTNLFEVIHIPLFLYVLYIIIMEGLGLQDLFIEYSIYLSIVGFLFVLFVYGFSGYRAAKLSELKIKPWIAGLFVGFVGSFVSFVISIVVMYFFPEVLASKFAEISSSAVDVEMMSNLSNVFVWIGGIVSLIFSSGFGALIGLIGGVIGRK